MRSHFRGFLRVAGIFIGGGLTAEGMVDTCWTALKPGGRLVANAVTIEGEQQLAAANKALGGELIRLSISRAGPVGTSPAGGP